MGFRILGYTGNEDFPDLPDMDIDTDIADLTWAKAYEKPKKKYANPYYEPDLGWATPDVDAHGRRNGKLVAIVRH